MSKLAHAITLSALLSTSFLASAQSTGTMIAFNVPATSSTFAIRDTRSAPAVNAVTLENFRNTFGANTETWVNITDGNRAMFKKNAISYLVDYAQDGNWRSTVRVYQQQHLPEAVQKLVSKNYPAYQILTTNEVTTSENLVYLVQIQDEYYLKTVSVNGGRIKQLKVYHRADH